jgi:hypothetical protein
MPDVQMNPNLCLNLYKLLGTIVTKNANGLECYAIEFIAILEAFLLDRTVSNILDAFSDFFLFLLGVH